MEKIVIAPDSFKGNIPAAEVCKIVAQAAKEVFPAAVTVSMPLSDGGEGFVDSMLHAKAGKRVTVTVNNPLMRPIEADYAILPDGTAVVEMAAASGLPLIAREQRNPFLTSTYGAGELIAHALYKGCRSILLGLGGSATNDGGIGAAAALGIRFLAQDGTLCLTGGDLSRIVRVDASGMHAGLRSASITIACDVMSPLCGNDGAAHVFAPQKGASQQDIQTLDEGLDRLARLLKTQFGKDLCALQGAGAAGGMALPLCVFANAPLRLGLDVVLDAMGFDRHMDADLVVTGEGRTDAQSAMGKVVSGVAKRAKAFGVPVVVLSGGLDTGLDALYAAGVTAAFATCRKVQTREQALEGGREALYLSAMDLFRLVRAFSQTGRIVLKA